MTYEKKSKSFIKLHFGSIDFQRWMCFFFYNPLLMFIDVLSIISLVLLIGGLVEFLIHGGYFDFMTYSFSSAKNLLTRRPEAQPQRYFDYAQKQKAKRKNSEHFVLKLAGLLLTLSVLLTIFYTMRH